MTENLNGDLIPAIRPATHIKIAMKVNKKYCKKVFTINAEVFMQNDNKVKQTMNVNRYLTLTGYDIVLKL